MAKVLRRRRNPPAACAGQPPSRATGAGDPAFRTKLAIGAELAIRARAARFAFREVVADSAYGDQDGFRSELAQPCLPFVMALKLRHGTPAHGPDAHTPVAAARALARDGPDDPGDWHPVTRAFHDGSTQTWRPGSDRGSNPARSSDDLPDPEGPTAISGPGRASCSPARASSFAVSCRRPDKRRRPLAETPPAPRVRALPADRNPGGI